VEKPRASRLLIYFPIFRFYMNIIHNVSAGVKTAVIWLLDNREVFRFAKGKPIIFVFPKERKEKTGLRTSELRFWRF